MGPPDLLQRSTPAVLMEERHLDRNLARMQAHVAAQFRPHVQISTCVPLGIHACAIAAQHAICHVVHHQRVTATWPRCGGW